MVSGVAGGTLAIGWGSVIVDGTRRAGWEKIRVVGILHTNRSKSLRLVEHVN